MKPQNIFALPSVQRFVSDFWINRVGFFVATSVCGSLAPANGSLMGQEIAYA
jgi:hypothetical protein